MSERRRARRAYVWESGVTGSGSAPRGSDRLGQMYERHYDALYSYFVRRTVGSHTDAADLASEVFVVAWRHLADIPEAPADRLWLYGTARRVLSTHRRSLRRRQRLTERLARQPERRDPWEPVDAFDHLRRLIEDLPRRDREILKLVYWDHLTHLDAAVVLGCSPVAATARLRRARNRLRDALGQDIGADTPPSTAGSAGQRPSHRPHPAGAEPGEAIQQEQCR